MKKLYMLFFATIFLFCNTSTRSNLTVKHVIDETVVAFFYLKNTVTEREFNNIYTYVCSKCHIELTDLVESDYQKRV